MREHYFLTMLQSLSCDSIDKYTQTMICLETTVLCHLLNNASRQLIHTDFTSIFSIYEQKTINDNSYIKLNQKEFKLIFSNITLYDFSQSRDIKNYIS
ncbi:type I restriction endonuclease subunit M, partial [Salmonella enterica subsp. enterica serovar Bareilly str. CFSAN001104]|nr:type I restriction endonuclease subunit M [Salmonella enterica subsp. enterica serovar Bareilly]ECH2250200.1 type I restriction endonuclease subunit M [Salmonella enterica]